MLIVQHVSGGRAGLLLAWLALALALTGCAADSASSSPPEATSTSATAATAPALPPLPGRLVYGRFGPDGVQLYIANTDGSDELALPEGVELPAWSPTGEKLSVVGQSPQGLVFVGLLNPDGSGYTRFDSPDPTLNLGCGAWSPDATRLACEGWDDDDPTRNGLYTVRASDGGDLARITTHPSGGHDAPGGYTPDGSQIVFVRIDLEDEEHSTLMVVDAAGGPERELTDTKVGLAAFVSPDGSQILTEADGSLLLVPIEGGDPTPIEIDAPPGSFATRGSWSPDGEHIVFSLALPGSALDIYTMRADGTELRQVTDTPAADEEFGIWGQP